MQIQSKGDRGWGFLITWSTPGPGLCLCTYLDISTQIICSETKTQISQIKMPEEDLFLGRLSELAFKKN